MKKKNPVVLITGGYGFAASYLIRHILSQGVTNIHILVRRNSSNERHKYLNIDNDANIRTHYGDLTDEIFVNSLINHIKPDIIFNLAAVMYVQDSWDIPTTTFHTNTLGVQYILNAVRELKKIGHRVRLVQAGTSEEYGDVKQNEVPILETNPLRPKSPYGVAKVAAEHLCKIYAKEFHLDIVVTRAFNHIGMTQNPNLVVPTFAREVAKAFYDGTPIHHGNLDSIRDFTSIEDIVKAYWLIGNSNYRFRGDAINICSGKDNSVTMGYILDSMIDYVKNNYDENFYPIYNPSYYRPNDVKILVGSAEMMDKLFGWKPQVSITSVIENMIKTEMEKYGNE